MREQIIRKIREKRKLSKEENNWLNKMLMTPKVFCRILVEVLGMKEETLSDKTN